MRDNYVPLFQDTLTSSVWALADLEVRIAWFFFLLKADEEGFVSGTAPGLAQQANISVEGMRRALAAFEAPDPDSRTPDHDGRRLERVGRGWRVLNLVAARKRAQLEAERSRKRRWAQAHRPGSDEGNQPGDYAPPAPVVGTGGPSSDDAVPVSDFAPSIEAAKEEAVPACDLPDREAAPVDAVSTLRSAPVDARKRTRKRTPSLPPPPLFKKQEEEEGPRFYDLDGFQPSPELVAYAERYGLPPMALHARLGKLRQKSPEEMRRIFGAHGVRDREAWCRDQLPTWKRWWLDDGGRAEPLPVRRPPARPIERQRAPAPLSACIPMPEELLRFVATGQLPAIQPARAAPAAVVAA